MKPIQPLAFAAVLCLLAGLGLSGCGTTKALEKRPSTIAVWDLDNLNPAELDGFNLGELLAAKVMEILEPSNQWVLVERKELILALEEQNLGASAAVSEETRLRIGRLLGANFMVFGSYMKFMEALQVNLRIVDVQTGRIIKASSNKPPVPFKSVGDALKMAGDAARELLE